MTPSLVVFSFKLNRYIVVLCLSNILPEGKYHYVDKYIQVVLGLFLQTRAVANFDIISVVYFVELVGFWKMLINKFWKSFSNVCFYAHVVWWDKPCHVTPYLFIFLNFYFVLKTTFYNFHKNTTLQNNSNNNHKQPFRAVP